MSRIYNNKVWIWNKMAHLITIHSLKVMPKLRPQENGTVKLNQCEENIMFTQRKSLQQGLLSSSFVNKSNN